MAGRRGAVPVLAAAMALAAAGGCERAPLPTAVSELVLVESELAPTLEEAGLDRARIVATVRSCLARAGFTLAPGDRRALRARVEVVALGFLPGAPSRRGELVVQLEVEPAWVEGASLRREGRGMASIAAPGRSEGWGAALEGATLSAASAIRLDLGARRKGSAELAGDLESGDPRSRERAIRSLAARGARQWARAVARAARDEDPNVRTAAVEALVALREPGTALALIEAAQASDPATTIRLIPVLAELGGPDARGWLEAVQEGHGDPAVRRAASEALPGSFPARMARP